MRLPVTEKEALGWIEKLTEKNELIATLKVELEAVRSERDYLRKVVAGWIPYDVNYWELDEQGTPGGGDSQRP